MSKGRITAVVEQRLSLERFASFEELRSGLLAAVGAESAGRLVVKYRDHEGDLVTITSDEELAEAYHLADQFLNGDLNLAVEVVNRVELAPAAHQPDVAKFELLAHNATMYVQGIEAQVRDFFAELKQEMVSATESRRPQAHAASAATPDTAAVGTQAVEPAAVPAAIAVDVAETASAAFVEASAPVSSDAQPPSRPASARDSDSDDRTLQILRPATRDATGVTVCDVTIPSGMEVVAGATFTKVWRVRTGASAWPAGARLVPIAGSFSATSELAAPVSPYSETEIAVRLRAPETPGVAQGAWILTAVDGKPFLREPLLCAIRVVEPSAPAPLRRSVFSLARSQTLSASEPMSGSVLSGSMPATTSTSAAASVEAAAAAGAVITDRFSTPSAPGVDEWELIEPADQPATITPPYMQPVVQEELQYDIPPPPAADVSIDVDPADTHPVETDNFDGDDNYDGGDVADDTRTILSAVPAAAGSVVGDGESVMSVVSTALGGISIDNAQELEPALQIEESSVVSITEADLAGRSGLPEEAVLVAAVAPAVVASEGGISSELLHSLSRDIAQLQEEIERRQQELMLQQQLAQQQMTQQAVLQSQPQAVVTEVVQATLPPPVMYPSPIQTVNHIPAAVASAPPSGDVIDLRPHTGPTPPALPERPHGGRFWLPVDAPAAAHLPPHMLSPFAGMTPATAQQQPGPDAALHRPAVVEQRTPRGQQPYTRRLPDEERYEHALTTLYEMGFRDRPRNLALLRRNMTVEAVIDMLLSGTA